MTTRMVHPQHGAMDAYNTNDIDYLTKLGWHAETEAEAAERAAVIKAKREANGVFEDEPEVEEQPPAKPVAKKTAKKTAKK